MSYGDPRVEPRRIPPIDLCHFGTADGTSHEYVNIRVFPEQRAPVRFTFFWTGVGLREKKGPLTLLKQKSEEHTVTPLDGARDEEHNEALVLKKILEGSR